jgi:hypothetical protein
MGLSTLAKGLGSLRSFFTGALLYPSPQHLSSVLQGWLSSPCSFLTPAVPVPTHYPSAHPWLPHCSVCAWTQSRVQSQLTVPPELLFFFPAHCSNFSSVSLLWSGAVIQWELSAPGTGSSVVCASSPECVCGRMGRGQPCGIQFWPWI